MPDETKREAPAPEPAPEAGPGGADATAPTDAEAGALRASVASLEEKLRRQQAEFLNDVQRIRRQAEEDRRFAVQPLLVDLLAVVDALHNGIEGLKDSEPERRMAEGLRLVERQLLEALAKYGVARIDAAGKPFDPAAHEAILEVEGTAPDRRVVQIVRPGFTLNGRVVRPAHVVVSRPRPAPAGDAAVETPSEEE
jgi:molecular chaperone GrpE